MESTVTRNWGLTILRVVVGIVYLAHGSQKLFVYGLGGVQGAFGQMGIPAPAVTGPFIALLEFVGGILLIFGFLTRWVALLFALVMLVAILKVHLSAGFFMPRGYEYALTLCAASAALALAGPGAAALDYIVFAKHGLGRGTLIDPT
jgi:putative oxidoreductase